MAVFAQHVPQTREGIMLFATIRRIAGGRTLRSRQKLPEVTCGNPHCRQPICIDAAVTLVRTSPIDLTKRIQTLPEFAIYIFTPRGARVIYCSRSSCGGMARHGRLRFYPSGRPSQLCLEITDGDLVEEFEGRRLSKTIIPLHRLPSTT